ncbi:GspE/PulE family protein [Aporhodopirellula aestuarii]|uniref:Flp pilus assembly complex ATPase component TadA n=1 Tax=Aporhodopirellula aestuarii TaxID=2950107 RepID=A0ABT0U9W3_9BACT|nr:ATPase, T2SS/T4P/T4SS family [Aporhodopirellula aestuarii]MCM2373725.1 Flp pilus assembly complex ATPase component TadA [Aporhodopirellula aestuarii]
MSDHDSANVHHDDPHFESVSEGDVSPDLVVPELNSPESFAIALMEIAAGQKASDIFISDEQDSTVIRFRRMGRLKIVRRLPRTYGRRLLNHFRALAGIDIADLMHPADGRVRFNLENNREVDVRFAVLPTTFGQDMAMRMFDHSIGMINIDDIGFLEDEKQVVHRMLTSPSGLILVAGATGSGKTNSLYAFLHQLNNGQRKIHTLEEPIEYTLPGIQQSQVNVRAGCDFADLLYGCMRQSPDVIMVGEIRDRRTAETAIRAGVSGHLVLATVHAQAATTAVQNMLSFDVNRHFLADALVGVLNQTLVRQLCTNCRVEVEDPDTSQRYFIGGKCEKCDEEGFTRMTCLPEILEATQRVAAAIARGDSADELGRIAMEEGMMTLAQGALKRIESGLITPEDAAMVMSDHRVRELATLAISHMEERDRASAA